ncbi:DUF6538 domain-containing protein [Asaia prunellae]|uniref:DUF6538 domain-containing protein n=1 Tax=Asaia prunellae TaxID=610245 RepID=UPI0034E287AE
MLRLIGSHYHFRRAVPKDIQPLLRRSEISLSLTTSAKLEARRRAAQLYDRTGQFFDKVCAMSDSKNRPPTPNEIITFYESFVSDTEKDSRHRFGADSAAKRVAGASEFLVVGCETCSVTFRSLLRHAMMVRYPARYCMGSYTNEQEGKVQASTAGDRSAIIAGKSTSSYHLRVHDLRKINAFYMTGASTVHSSFKTVTVACD